MEKDLAFQVGFLPGDINLPSLVAFWTYDDSDPEHNRYFWPTNWARRNRQQLQMIADWVKTGAFPDVREGEH